MSVYRVAALVPARKIYVHCEAEVHTVYQRLLKKLGEAYTPCNPFLLILHAYNSFVQVRSLKVFE